MVVKSGAWKLLETNLRYFDSHVPFKSPWPLGQFSVVIHLKKPDFKIQTQYSTLLLHHQKCMYICMYVHMYFFFGSFHTVVLRSLISIMTVKHNNAFLLTCYFINYRMSLWLHVSVIVWPSSGLQELSYTCSYCASMFYRET